jgi:RimJ/RimL family protein N-acetyltransferase
VITADVFRDQPTLYGPRLRLEPMGPEHFDGMAPALTDPEIARLTGSTGQVTLEQARQWMATRRDQHDRADWAIVRAADGQTLGEVVLNELDEHSASVNFRILLARPELFGHGYGTEATGLTLDYAFDTAGLHRIGLEVYDFNPRARRSYEKSGFVVEGIRRDALRWGDAWHDSIVMSILSTDPRPGTANG